MEAPASTFVTQAQQIHTAAGFGLFDWLAHAQLQLTGQPEPIPLAPFFYSYVFGVWSQYSQGRAPAAEQMPAFPPTDPLPVSAVVTSAATTTITRMSGVCWADGEQVVDLVTPYRTQPYLISTLADGAVIHGLQHGSFDRVCAGNPPPPLADWCAWITYNLPGPLGSSDLAKLPTRNGRLVPILIAQGTNDGVVYCVTPDATDAIPPAKDCMSVALFDALKADYCPGSEQRGHLMLQIWQPEPGVTTADHSDITGLVAAASTDDLTFQGSPLQRFMEAAFAGTLTPGCTAAVANPNNRS